MDAKCNFAKKKNRRSVLNSARRNLPDVDETNNYQLADALAKTRVELSKAHTEKFKYVSQNLKLMETIVHLKDENKKLSMRLEEREVEIENIQKLLNGHESSIQQLNRTFDDLQVTVQESVSPNPTTVQSPPSLVSSFDSGLNSSSINSSAERHEAPLAAKQLFSPELVPEKDITRNTVPDTESDKENSETPRTTNPFLDIPIKSFKKRQKRKHQDHKVKDEFCEAEPNSPPADILLETPQINSKKAAFTKRRETPSRSAAKLAMKSLVEPKLGRKLRQGDPNTDPFFLNPQ